MASLGVDSDKTKKMAQALSMPYFIREGWRSLTVYKLVTDP